MTLRLAGVVGWPVAQSLSPQLHAFWLREHAVDGAYVALPVRSHDLSAVLNGLRKAGFAGVNVTVPHKEAAFALGSVWDSAAEAAGAANLLVFAGDRVEARNTDVEGLSASLVEEFGRDEFAGKTATILGAGGAARAAILACDRLMVRTIHLLNRTPGRAGLLAQHFAAVISARPEALSFEEWPTIAASTNLLINTTSAGTKGTPSPEIRLELLPRDAIVCDIIYNPLETPLLRRARAIGLRGTNGLGMLMHQAVPAFEAFFGVRPAVSSILRADLEKALR